MHTITIQMRARLYLLALIAQDSGGLEDEKRMLSTDLLDKLELPKDELGLYETPVANGGAYLHLDRIAQAPALEVDLSPAELRRAQSLITEWKSYRPGDDRFIRPLLKDIRNALEGAGQVLAATDKLLPTATAGKKKPASATNGL